VVAKVQAKAQAKVQDQAKDQAKAHLAQVDGLTKVVVGKVEKYAEVAFVGRGAVDEACTEVQARITLPENTRLDRAVFEISAAPGEATKVSSVATVREAAVPPSSDTKLKNEHGCTIDFGRLVSVADFYLSNASATAKVHATKDRAAKTRTTKIRVSTDRISRIFPWTGVGWSTTPMSGTKVQEMQTERLLVTSNFDDVVETVEKYGVVDLPTQPTGLELQVEGTTVWFERQGSTADLASPPAATGSYRVDRTDAVRDALAKARPSGGNRVVTATLRATTPGQLALTVRAEILHEYHAPLASNAFTSTTPLAEEQLLRLELSEHDDKSPFEPTDTIRKVSLTVRGAFGPERVEPVEEPALVPLTTLVLGGGRTVLLGIRDVLTAQFGALQAVRLQVSSPKGGELAGRLLTGDHLGRPGGPVKGGEVPPVTVAASTEPAWLTIPFPDPVALPDPKSPDTLPRVPYWLELTATYGEVACGVTRDTVVPAAPLLRRLPGGGARALTVLGRTAPPGGDEPPLHVPLRVVGLPGKKQPLPAVTFSVDGLDLPEDPGTTPTPEGLGLDIRLGDGVRPSLRTATPTRLVLPVQLRVRASGTLTLEDVVVLFQKGDKTK
jgi:hypothetical protein